MISTFISSDTNSSKYSLYIRYNKAYVVKLPVYHNYVDGVGIRKNTFNPYRTGRDKLLSTLYIMRVLGT